MNLGQPTALDLHGMRFDTSTQRQKMISEALRLHNVFTTLVPSDIGSGLSYQPISNVGRQVGRRLGSEDGSLFTTPNPTTQCNTHGFPE